MGGQHASHDLAEPVRRRPVLEPREHLIEPRGAGDALRFEPQEQTPELSIVLRSLDALLDERAQRRRELHPKKQGSRLPRVPRFKVPPGRIKEQ
jgi:hypothetical protein